MTGPVALGCWGRKGEGGVSVCVGGWEGERSPRESGVYKVPENLIFFPTHIFQSQFPSLFFQTKFPCFLKTKFPIGDFKEENREI